MSEKFAARMDLGTTLTCKEATAKKACAIECSSQGSILVQTCSRHTNISTPHSNRRNLLPLTHKRNVLPYKGAPESKSLSRKGRCSAITSTEPSHMRSRLQCRSSESGIHRRHFTKSSMPQTRHRKSINQRPNQGLTSKPIKNLKLKDYTTSDSPHRYVVIV